jgi:hypothetical protein
MFQYDPQAVIVRYQVRAGSEDEFQTICAEAWQMYLRLGLIHDRPHVMLRAKDEAGATYFLELVPWKDRAITNNPPPEVGALWTRLQAVCEARQGHRAIEFPDFQVMRED